MIIIHINHLLDRHGTALGHLDNSDRHGTTNSLGHPEYSYRHGIRVYAQNQFYAIFYAIRQLAYTP